ncbi:Pre-mRNA-splicing factor CWC25 like protein [Dufourea novaeangliae]|uniref:Pre-mRNA-splicing factor CWC25 like protein n=2 Tax=Dufourea novaeangliae TaxID=178035 RepID=A0A154P9R7_DUFNO|nr:Pre-mRNA-splicing factor CWC25 like protein [Dufourea novaeangliae]
MKNMEKVWKAEQQQSQEKKRIAELKREIEMEKDREDIKKYAMEQGVIEGKDDKKLDWMYKGPNQLINREDYLLGKPIDKSFEQIAQTEKDNVINQAPRNHVEHECIPPSLRFFSGNEQVDLARKMQEDPLYAIKKKEMETRNQLLKNPVKLKQLRQLLEQQSKKSKIEKKQKKRKKHKEDIDSDDEIQLDMLLAAKYKQLKNKITDKDLKKSMEKIKHKRRKKLRKESESSSSSESESSIESSTSDESTQKCKRKKRSKSKENNTQSKKHNKEKYTEKSDKKGHKKQRISETQFRMSHSSNRERSDSSSRRKKCIEYKRDIHKNKDREFHSGTPQDKEYSSRSSKYNSRNNDDKHNPNKLSDKKISYSKSFSDMVQEKYKDVNRNKDQWSPKKKHHLTDEEKERRRQEMIANATWRNKERQKNVKKYTEEERKEINSRNDYNQDFVRKHLAAAAEVGTVASRIKANINNIQRSGRAMDTNFAKR